MIRNLGFHPLDPPRPPHLLVAQLADQHHIEYLPTAVVDDRLDNPQSLLD